MLKSAMLLPVFCLTTVYGSAQKLPPDTVRGMIRDLSRELSLKHPGYYRYRSASYFKRYADSLSATVTDSLTELETFRKLKPFIGQIGCLHTDLQLSPAVKAEMAQRPVLFPLQLYFKGQKAYVARNASGNKSIVPGSEVLSINGRSIPQILDILLPAIASDGFNQTLRYRSLYNFFPLQYSRMIEVTDQYTVKISHLNKVSTCQLKGALTKDIAAPGFMLPPDNGKPLACTIKEATAVLSVHSFADSDIKEHDQDFKLFIVSAFADMRAQGVKHLILDLRDNTGGSDGNAAFLAGYFFDKPYRYWDRIEVTETIAGEIKGEAEQYYRKPVQEGSRWLWKKAKVVNDFDYYETQQPAVYPFTGKAYVLTNGFTMSSAADLSAVLKFNKKAVFIGEETGGGFQGNNSGMMPESELKPSGMVVTIPLQKYYTAVDSTLYHGKGTLPDYPVSYTPQELVNDKDKEMALAEALIRKPSK